MKEFIKLCQKSQKQLKCFLSKELQKKYTDVREEDGFLYAQGTFPVLLVAHMDTVHKTLPINLELDNESMTLSSPQGIGGDDRCGIYMILQIIKRFPCSVLFTEDEEIGCVGARKFAKQPWVKDLQFNYMIELDRAGWNDAVFYDCDNKDFEQFILQEFFELKYGSYTDICEIAPVVGCAAVNLSCGYYKAHTASEYVNLREMRQNIKEVIKLLMRTQADNKYIYVERPRFLWDRYGGYDYDKYEYEYDLYSFFVLFTDEQGMDAEEIYDGASVEEVIGQWAIAHPALPYNCIEDIVQDECAL